MNNIVDILPLSYIQESMLYRYFAYPDSYCNFEFLHFKLKGYLNKSYLIQAWHEVFRRHPILNSFVRWKDCGDIYHIYTIDEPKVTCIQVNQPHQKQKIIEQKRKYRVNIRKHLMEVTIICEEKEADLLISAHHMIYDGWSTNIILSDFIECYIALVKYKEIQMECRDIGYKAVMKYQKNINYEPLIKFYQIHLKGYKTRTVKKNSGNISYNTKKSYYQKLNGITELEIKKAAGRLQVAPSAFFITIWARIMMKFYKQEEVIVGVVFSGRSAAITNIEYCVGPLINILPLRIKQGNMKNMIMQVQRDMAELSSIQTIPLNFQEINHKIPFIPMDSVVLFQNYIISDSINKHDDIIEIFPKEAEFFPDNVVTFEVRKDCRDICIQYRYEPDIIPDDFIKAAAYDVIHELEILRYIQ